MNETSDLFKEDFIIQIITISITPNLKKVLDSRCKYSTKCTRFRVSIFVPTVKNYGLRHLEMFLLKSTQWRILSVCWTSQVCSHGMILIDRKTLETQWKTQRTNTLLLYSLFWKKNVLLELMTSSCRLLDLWGLFLRRIK